MSRVLTFKLGATGTLPEVDWEPTVAFNPPKASATPELVREGFALYSDVCMGCHGLNAVSGMLVPDLRGSGFLHDQAGWDAVVREGALRQNGMASFAEQVSTTESQAIRAYVIQEAWRALEAQIGQEGQD